jgi:hypothetical protein
MVDFATLIMTLLVAFAVGMLMGPKLMGTESPEAAPTGVNAAAQKRTGETDSSKQVSSQFECFASSKREWSRED